MASIKTNNNIIKNIMMIEMKNINKPATYWLIVQGLTCTCLRTYDK